MSRLPTMDPHAPFPSASAPFRGVLHGLVAAALLTGPPAHAGPDVSAFVNVTSDYVYRSYSKSANHVTAQANIEAQGPRGSFAGAWLSGVRLGEARVEAIPYAGIRRDLGPDWRLDALVAGYLYDDDVHGISGNYAEIYLLLHYRDLLTGRVGVAPDAYGRGAAVPGVQAEGRYPITDALEASATVGYEHARQALHYDNAYASAGLTWFPHRQVSVDLRYHIATDFNDLAHIGPDDPLSEQVVDNPVVLTLSLGF